MKRVPEVCPVCGAEVPQGAKACPGCGADEKTGWSEEARYDDLDLPDDQFDYEEFVRREFGGKNPVPKGIPWFWWLIAMLLLALFLLPWLFRAGR
jgi:hypothetical protein